jgi:molybdate transport system substrate-binding protein
MECSVVREGSMMMHRRFGLVLLSLTPLRARGQTPTPPVFAAGAVKHGVEILLDEARARGQAVPEAIYDTVGTLRDRILAGERPAVALLSDEAMARLVQGSLVVKSAVARIGRTGVAIAAPAGRPLPDISTPEAFRTALMAAESLAFADPARGATAGRHFAAVLERLGIAEAMRPKLRLVRFGVEGVDMVSRGEVAWAVSQATEILGREGVTLVGLLPEPLQSWTGYAVGQMREGEEARALMRLFTSEAARAVFARTGFQPS